MRVVLAHPSAHTRGRFAGVLAGAGHAVVQEDSVDDALALCREDPPDVVVVDAQLCPDEQALLSALKRDPTAYRAAVVLVEHGEIDLQAAVRALKGGVQDFLIDPVTDAELLARVEAAGRTAVLQQELVEQSRRLEALIFEDPLTGLANRRSILTQLAGQVSGARRHGRALSVAIVDIDRFKGINDRFGHAVGDDVLAAVTGTVRRRLRAEDQLGRLGGEEFLALLPDTGGTAAAAAAEKLRNAVRGTAVMHEGRRISVTASVGWAAWDGESPEELLRRADEALYEAKALGRDRVAGAAPASLHRRT
jgi:two-component system, cell cycle response regulator